MKRRQKILVLGGGASTVAAIFAAYALAAPPVNQAVQGKQLYRQFCGQCHALTQALAAGFGSANGLGQDGGPSFNNLRIPYDLSVVAVTEQFGGHELVVKRMSWQQLDEVAAFLAAATKNNPYLARVSDG